MLTTGILWGFYLSFAPYVLKVLIDAIALNSSVSVAVQAAKWPAIIYVLLWVFIASLFRFMDWIHIRFYPALRHDITTGMFSYLNLHAYDFFQNNFAGSLANKVSDMQNGAVSLMMKTDEFAAQFFALLIASAMMYFVNPIFTFILLIWVVVLMVATVFFSKQTHSLSHIYSESKSKLVGRMVDSLSNFMNIMSFARHKHENAQIADAVTDTVVKDRAMQWAVLKMRIYQDIAFVVMIASMIGALLYLYSLGEVTVGDFVLIMTLTLSISQSLWWVASQLVIFAEELGKCSQALSIIVKPHTIVDKVDAKSLVIEQGNITYKDIDFRYQNSSIVFSDFSVTIDAKQKIGLVGFSGSGKTTFVNLLLRYFELNAGKICIDGQDISKVTLSSLRQAVAMIPQDTTLFHRSLMENIRYGRLDATDDKVISAAKRAHCHEFINELTEGYETFVGERGIKLSGGQRQRIAIARAFLKNAKILVLDEATSALDSVTEKMIHESLDELMQDKTTIIIAHRLSTLAEVDKILVFDKGQLLESGSHSELLANKGHYANLWHMQVNGFLPNQ